MALSVLMNDLLAHSAPSDKNGFADEMNQQKLSDGSSQAAVNAPADCIMLAEGHGGWPKGVGLPDPNPDASGVIQNPIPANPNRWHQEHTISGNFTPFITGNAYDASLPPTTLGLPFYTGGNNFAFTDGHAKWVRTIDQAGRPTLCSTLPWVKTMDPQQRNVDDTSSYCGNKNPILGSNWGGHQWY